MMKSDGNEFDPSFFWSKQKSRILGFVLPAKNVGNFADVEASRTVSRKEVYETNFYRFNLGPFSKTFEELQITTAKPCLRFYSISR